MDTCWVDSSQIARVASSSSFGNAVTFHFKASPLCLLYISDFSIASLTDARPRVQLERCGDDEMVNVAGWPVARLHPRGRDGPVFVTTEDEKGDVQVIVWRDLFSRHRRELGS